MRAKDKLSATERNLLTAKKIARLFSGIDNVVAITAGGSLSRGFSDKYSDIEMYVYYEHQMPDKKDIASILEKLHAPLTRSKKIFWFHEAWGYHTFFKVDGVKIELGYRNTQDIERRMDFFLKSFSLPRHGIHDTPFGHYESGVANCILESVILYKKNNWFRTIQSKLKAYPKRLKEATLEYYYRDAKVMTDVKIRQAIDRNDTLHFHACLARVLRSLNLCIFALNEKYYPGDKWNDKYISKFSVIPEDYISDTENILQKGCVVLEDKKVVYRMLHKMIHEVHFLIKQQA